MSTLVIFGTQVAALWSRIKCMMSIQPPGNHLQVENFVFVVTICHQQCFQCLHASPCVPGGQIRTTWKLTTVLKKKSVLRTPKMLHQKHTNIKQKNPYSTWHLAPATPTLWKWVLLPRVGGKLTVGSWACTYDRVIMGFGIHPIYFCFYLKEISEVGILVFHILSKSYYCAV